MDCVCAVVLGSLSVAKVLGLSSVAELLELPFVTESLLLLSALQDVAVAVMSIGEPVSVLDDVLVASEVLEEAEDDSAGGFAGVASSK